MALRVCVADDCADETTVLCEGLKLHGYEAVSAATGEEALEICKNQEIDLLLLDVNMPGMSGFEVCERLKAGEDTAGIPVIFVTGRGEAHDVDAGFSLGATDYIAKPYNLPMVMVRVDSALRTRQLHDTLLGGGVFLDDPVYTDTLTGLRNRRFLEERLEEEVSKAHRYGYPLTCLLLDVDEIKALDKEQGAAPLDDLLVDIALALRNSSRNYDILCRFDGAVFAAVLPHVSTEDAVKYARKIREEIGALSVTEPVYPSEPMVSFGIATCRNGQARDANDLVGHAMRNLLCATTREGDERIVAHELGKDGQGK